VYKKFDLIMQRFGYYVNHSSWIARIIAVLGLSGTWLLFRAFLMFFPYLLYAIDQFRLDSLDQWYLPAILISPVIILIGAIAIAVNSTVECLKTFTRGRLLYQPFTPIRGRIEIKRT
jgi:hypothetical protein